MSASEKAGERALSGVVSADLNCYAFSMSNEASEQIEEIPTDEQLFRAAIRLSRPLRPERLRHPPWWQPPIRPIPSVHGWLEHASRSWWLGS